MGPDRFLEIRYEQLVADTEKQMRQVLEFVGEPWDGAVLHHTEHPHDVMGRYDSYTAKRRSQRGEGAVYRSRRRRPQGQRPAHEVVAPVAGRFHPRAHRLHMSRRTSGTSAAPVFLIGAPRRGPASSTRASPSTTGSATSRTTTSGYLAGRPSPC